MQMALINWDASLSVNVKEIDGQHQKLIKIINDLHEAMLQKKAKEILGKIIDELIAYTTTHFLTEETYFEKFEYSDRLNHKRRHTDFVKKVGEFNKEFAAGKLMLSMDIMTFLKEWLVKHIQGEDKKYEPFFNSKGLV
jgi:hemerythrin